MRFRLLWAVVVPIVPIAALFWPVVLTYTFVAGERATAQVSECHRLSSGRISELKCTGTWRADGGDIGSGEIYGLGRRDVGGAVEVRIGPMGPYGHGFTGSWHQYFLSLFLLSVFGGVVVRRNRARRRADPLLAAPAAHGDLLIVMGRGVRTPDGQPYASVLAVFPPSARRPVGVKVSHWEVCGAQGQPMFRVEQREGKKIAPEFVLLDLSGAPRAIIRRTGTSPVTYALLFPDGTPLGRIDATAGAKWGAFEIKDTQGRTWARTATRIPEWILRIEPGAPPTFPYLALAFTIGQRRSSR
jgi:hypothetical protein